MNPVVVAEIGKVCGEVQQGLREWGNQEGSTFMRIRIGVNLTKPLCRGRKIHHEDGEIGWVRFKYERLPNMCYWCSQLTHSDKECDLWVRSKGSLTENDRQYGAWLRAPTFNSRMCTTIRVGGVDEEASGDEPTVGVEKEVRSESISVPSEENGSTWAHGAKPRGEDGGVRTVTSAKPPQVATDYVISEGAIISENNARGKLDFQEVLRGIDVEISKFDSTVVGSGLIGPDVALVPSEGCPTSNTRDGVGLSSELIMVDSIQGSPQDHNYKTCSWKRLLRDRNPTETQPVPIMKKRPIRDSEDISEDVQAGKKLRVPNTDPLPMVEAARQPRRKP